MDKKIIFVGIVVLLILSCMMFSGCINKTNITDSQNNGSDNKQNSDYTDIEEGDNQEGEQQNYEDSDGDGYYDYEDEFPYNSSEWKDSDNDGYGDNSDAFPKDSSEWLDSDGDGHGDNGDVFPQDASEWKDSDNDGHGDNSDAFPNDASEWVDSDNDGRGDNSDPYPHDYDNDGFADDVDINKKGDAGIKISLQKFQVKDELDIWPLNSVEVYFEVFVNGVLQARIDQNGESWDATVDDITSINQEVILNIDDDQRYTDIRIVMWDDDFFSEAHDVIDIDGHNESGGLSIVYDAKKEVWTGDDTDGKADGREDGSWESDDDDGILWYDITTRDIKYDKTYTWNYNGYEWSTTLSIPPEKYASYNQQNVDRSPYPWSEGAQFVTSNDDVIQELADTFSSSANKNGYDYYETANFALKFVQNLEYSFDNATTAWNEYWRYPVETLVEEGGDCEDTSILYASIMEAMGYDAVLLLLPGHAAVGVEGSNYYGSHYSYNGVDYYYCESTSPYRDLGEMPEQYKQESATIIQVE